MLTSVKKNVLTKDFAIGLAIVIIGSLLLSLFPSTIAFASDPDIGALVKQLINIIGSIFRIVGVLLLVYSIGQLVLAFKNEDADSKTRASTTLVIAAVLISLPTIINNLGLDQYVTIDVG